jgi:glycosyltransferase involved in cell wall biosynthesis
MPEATLNDADTVRFESVTILSTVKNIVETESLWLDSILSQDYAGKIEIVVIDGGSTDGTLQILHEYAIRHPQLKVTTFPSTQPQALNYALDQGLITNELVALIDGDCVAPTEWLLTLVETLHKERVDAVGGPGLTPPRAGILRRIIGLDLDGRFLAVSEGPVQRHPNMNLIVKTKVLSELRFSEDLPVGYDADFSYRLNEVGYRLWYNPKAAVLHYHRATLRSYVRQQMLYARYAGRLRHRGKPFLTSDNIVSGTMLLEPVLAALVIVVIPFAFFSIYIAAVSVVLVSSLFALFALDVGRTLKVRGERAVLLLFPLYVIRVFAWIVGAARGAIGARD